MSTLKELLKQSGFKKEKELSELLYTTGGLDGQIKKLPEEFDSEQFLRQELQDKNELNGKLQQNYFKKYRSGERQQILRDPALDAVRDRAIELFEEMGFVNTVSPEQNEYDFGYINGATENGMKTRINDFKKLEQGQFVESFTDKIKVKQVFIGTGDRALWLDSDSDPSTAQIISEKLAENGIQKSADAIKDEGALAAYNASLKILEDRLLTKKGVAIRYDELKKDRQGFLDTLESNDPSVQRRELTKYFKDKYDVQYPSLDDERKAVVEHFEKYGIEYPTEADAARKLIKEDSYFKGRDVLIIDAKGKDGKRVTTFDPIEKWNNNYGSKLSKSKNYSMLSISNQPYVEGQAVPFKLMPDNVKVDVVGNEVGSKYNDVLLETLLSEFAGLVYKTIQLDKHKNTTQDKAPQFPIVR